MNGGGRLALFPLASAEKVLALLSAALYGELPLSPDPAIESESVLLRPSGDQR